AVPKTGTHAVRQALREHLAEDDLEQVGLFVNRRFPWPRLAAIGHGHLALRQVRPYLGDETFGAYCKFAFVRNPFDRFVS
ncbi:sulfotransferase family 2 domain-containing protein, partial [Serratia liquefaciens]|uniref:sulfotransferase family 2 domain-containing protein n=1 Tax=Serratia liquefaciens TaxID=614 RepID=UPI0023605DA7